MKKLLISLFLLTTLGCANTIISTPEAVDPYPQLTAENILNACKATETWTIRVMPMPVAVVRYGDGCGGVSDLLLFVTPATDYTKTQRELTAKLAVTYYIQYLEREKAVNGKEWNVEAIKQEVADQQEIFYFNVTSNEVKTK